MKLFVATLFLVQGIPFQVTHIFLRKCEYQLKLFSQLLTTFKQKTPLIMEDQNTSMFRNIVFQPKPFQRIKETFRLETQASAQGGIWQFFQSSVMFASNTDVDSELQAVDLKTNWLTSSKETLLSFCLWFLNLWRGNNYLEKEIVLVHV